ncbi:MAG: nucleotidyltransferase family protein [Phycisphaerales bacterium]|nr:nucleotidyltransferase family protein [Phycisphaerales bacterium]
MSVIGVLLAAGRGRRLGGNKQLSRWPTQNGSERLITSSFDHIAVACDEIVVVLGHRHIEVQDVLRPREYATVYVDADAEMAHSVLAGLAFALRAKDVDCILIQPADHPQVAPSTLDTILRTARALDTAVAPQHRGNHGHPIAIPTRLAKEITNSGLPLGLAEWFRADSSRRTFIEVDDPSVLIDIDTPEDLAEAANAASSANQLSTPG